MFSHGLFRRYWSVIRVILISFLCRTFDGTHCKPLQQQSNDRLLMGNNGVAITNVYDLDSANEMTLNDQSQDSDNRLEKLTRTMDALAQFRQMINNRLLTKTGLVPVDDDNREDNFDVNHRRNSLLVDAENERTVQKTPAPQRRKNHHHRRKHGQDAGTTGRPYVREQREDPELQSSTYRIHGFNIKAHLQPETSARDSVPQMPEQEQRFMTGRTTAIDEQQLRLFSELPHSEFGEIFFHFHLLFVFFSCSSTFARDLAGPVPSRSLNLNSQFLTYYYTFRKVCSIFQFGGHYFT